MSLSMKQTQRIDLRLPSGEEVDWEVEVGRHRTAYSGGISNEVLLYSAGTIFNIL